MRTACLRVNEGVTVLRSSQEEVQGFLETPAGVSPLQALLSLSFLGY